MKTASCVVVRRAGDGAWLLVSRGKNLESWGLPGGKGRQIGEHEVLWSDLAGPMDVATRSGERYVLGILDEYTRWLWVFTLKTKSEAVIKFDEFLTRHSDFRSETLDTQFGFRKLCGTDDYSVAMSATLHTALERGQEALVVALDVAGAFDKVWLYKSLGQGVDNIPVALDLVDLDVANGLTILVLPGNGVGAVTL